MKSTIIGANALQPSISVFPNPAGIGEAVSIQLEPINSDVQLQMFNAQGKLIHSEMVKEVGQNIIALNVRGAVPGLYLLRMSGKDWQRSVSLQMF